MEGNADPPTGEAKAKGKGKRTKDVARLDGWVGAWREGEAHPPTGGARTKRKGRKMKNVVAWMRE